ncbi:MAG: hypothetical protein AB7P04_10395 [Bacteriovoracia bacterium]
MSVINAEAATEATAQPSMFSLDALLSASTSLHTGEQAARASEMQLWLTPGIRISENWKLTALGIITQNLENEMGVTMSDVEIGARRKGWELNPFLKFSPGIGMKVPGSKTSVVGRGFRTSIAVKPRLMYDLSALKIWGLRAISGYYQASGTRNFHEFNTSITGVSNSQYSFVNTLRVNVAFTEKLSLTLDQLFTAAWTYEGTPKSTFEMGQELSYEFTESFALGVGHNNSGNMYKENGLDSNLQFFNQDHSTVYMSAAFKL